MKKKELERALRQLVDFVPECWPLNIRRFTENQRCMGRIPKRAPFVSETSLYTILGKEDARTLRALIRNVAEAAGFERFEIEM